MIGAEFLSVCSATSPRPVREAGNHQECCGLVILASSTLALPPSHQPVTLRHKLACSLNSGPEQCAELIIQYFIIISVSSFEYRA